MSRYEKNNLVIVVLLAMSFIISATLVYFIYFNEPIVPENKDSIFVEITDKEVINKLKDTIDKNNLIVLSSRDRNVENINTIPNKDKLEMAYKTLVDEDTKENGITDEKIDSYFKNIFDTTIYWNKENIKCTCDNDLYIYNNELSKYEYNENHEEHELSIIKPIYSKVLDAEKKNDIYVIKMSYIWTYYDGSNEYITSGYSNYNDIEKNIKLFDIELPEEIDTEDINYYAVKEIDDNYDKYIDKLHTYIYTFIEKDGKYLLQSFRYER